jgi:hypothetical protein
MKTCGSGGVAPPFLTSALDGGEWSASRHGHFTPGERAPNTHCIGGWMGTRAGLDALTQRKISCPCRPARSLLGIPNELSRLLLSAWILKETSCAKRSSIYFEGYCLWDVTPCCPVSGQHKVSSQKVITLIPISMRTSNSPFFSVTNGS